MLSGERLKSYAKKAGKGVLAAALAAVSAYIKEEHKEKAQQMLQKWLG